VLADASTGVTSHKSQVTSHKAQATRHKPRGQEPTAAASLVHLEGEPEVYQLRLVTYSGHVAGELGVIVSGRTPRAARPTGDCHCTTVDLEGGEGGR